MDFKVILSPASIESLASITAWIAKDNASAAECIGNELLDRIEMLQKFPQAGSIYSGNKKWRKLVSNPYVIVYRVKPGQQTVEVLAFRHSAREGYTG